MTVAEKLERLARLVPGVAGYQDRERARETDRALRLRLVMVLEQAARDVEAVKRACVETGRLATLPGLDGLTSRLERLGATVRYASRGYRGLFDAVRVGNVALDKLYAFDLRMFGEAEVITQAAARLRASETAQTADAARALADALEGFERSFAERETLIAAG